METIYSSQCVYNETCQGAQLGVLLYNGAFQTLHGRFTHNTRDHCVERLTHIKRYNTLPLVC